MSGEKGSEEKETWGVKKLMVLLHPTMRDRKGKPGRNPKKLKAVTPPHPRKTHAATATPRIH